MSIVQTSKSNNWEYLVPVLVTVSLIVACAIASAKKTFWNDELLSFYLLNDPSFTHMMIAWGDTFNQAPPLYFILGWVWAKLFGNTELSLRLFSSLSISVAFTLVWITLRRTYNFWAVSIGTLSVFCLSELILYHNVEVRMYGLFAAVCALGLLQFDAINRTEKYSTKLLVTNNLIHSAIVLTHLYGILYSGAILAVFILRDIYFFKGKNWRNNVYLSVILGWSVLIPCIAPLLNQSNNHAKWFTHVSSSTLLNYFIFSPKFALLVLALLLASVFLYISKEAATHSYSRSQVEPGNDMQEAQPPLVQDVPSTNFSAEFSLLLLAGAFMAVPILAWIISLTIKPMLNDRYIIPTIAISWPILMAYLSSRLFPNFRLLNQQKLILVVLTASLLIHPIYSAKVVGSYSPKPGMNDQKYGYSELPIAMEAGHDFLPRFHYSSKPSRYFHILDWEIALKNTESAYATGNYTHIAALQRRYPFINIMQNQDFLDKYDRFLVLNETDQKWFEWRVQNNPKYQVKSLGIVEEGAVSPLELFLVDRKK